MGFLRFRRSISLGRFLRLNVSKTGLSTSFGQAPFTVNLRGDKVRETISAPGTGLSCRTTSRIGSPDVEPPAAPGAGLGALSMGGAVVLLIAILMLLAFWR